MEVTHPMPNASDAPTELSTEPVIAESSVAPAWLAEEADALAQARLSLRWLAAGLGLSLVPMVGQFVGIGMWVVVMGIERWLRDGPDADPSPPAEAGASGPELSARGIDRSGNATVRQQLLIVAMIDAFTLMLTSGAVLIFTKAKSYNAESLLLCSLVFSELLTWERSRLVGRLVTPWATLAENRSAIKDLRIGPVMVTVGGLVGLVCGAWYGLGETSDNVWVPSWLLGLMLMAGSLRAGGLAVVTLGVWQVASSLGDKRRLAAYQVVS